MNGNVDAPNSLVPEPEIVTQLGRIDGGDCDMTQRRANALFARIAWARIAEPADSVAGSLIRSLGVEGALGFLVQHPTPEKLREAVAAVGKEISSKAAAESIARWLPRLQRNETVMDIGRAAQTGLRIVTPGDETWPTALDDLDLHAPTMLWVKGSIAQLKLASLGVVGARAATGYGSHVTAELVGGVCDAGIAIISGAAYGIDAVAHRTALAAGVPTTAVMAGGADRAYPRAHERLLEKIGADGAVCSEMIPGAAPTRWRFLMRNRLIAALSRATLVTEAGVRSGSLNTAGHASQLGRPVGAVPGPITSAASAGCHKLLREYDAALITTSREACELVGVTDELDLFGGVGAESRDSAWHRRVLDAIPLRGGLVSDEIARTSGLTPGQTINMLAELELLGRVKRDHSDEVPVKWSLARRQ